MAQKYGWGELNNKLVNFNYCHIEQLKQIQGFMELNLDSQLKLAAKRIPKAVNVSGSQVAFKLINEIIKANEKQEENYEENNENKITLFKSREADWKVVSSGDDEDEISFMAHSQILKFYSKVFDQT